MKRYNKDGYHAEHPEGKFVLLEDVKEEIEDYYALKESVAWVKECELVRHYVIFDSLETCALREITSSISAARAEVDRLIGGGE